MRDRAGNPLSMGMAGERDSFLDLAGALFRDVVPRVFVLRWLRCSAFLRRHAALGTLPMWPATLSVIVFYLAIGVYGGVLNGSVRDLLDDYRWQVGQIMQDMPGFSLRHVSIGGDFLDYEDKRRHEIMSALDVSSGDMFFLFDAHAAWSRIRQIPWVGQAEVRKLFPDRIEVIVDERVPFAIWQHDGDMDVVDRYGAVIEQELDERHRDLPLVVGVGANIHAEALMSEMAGRPVVRDRLRAAVRVADRRWNLRLQDGVEIRLPEKGLSAALDEIVFLDNVHDILDRDVVFIDLRLADRVTMRLSPDVASHRKAMFELQRAEHLMRRRDI